MCAELEDKTLLSPKAIELLDCFSESLEEVVYQLAEAIAKQEGSFADAEKQVPLIEKNHVQKAAQLLFETLQKALEEDLGSYFPPDRFQSLQKTLQDLHLSLQCLEEKALP